MLPPNHGAVSTAFSDFWPALNAQLAKLGKPEAEFGEAQDVFAKKLAVDESAVLVMVARERLNVPPAV